MFGETFSNWFNRSDKKSLAAPEPWLLSLFGAPETVAGVEVTPISAMQVPAVSAAVSLISGSVGNLPAKVFASGPQSGKAPDTDHPAHRLVHDEANDWQSAAQFRAQLTIDALLHGNGYGYVNRAGNRPIELIRLNPSQTSVMIDSRTGEPVFQSTDTKETRTFSYRDVIHIPALSLDGVTGCPPVHMAREAIALAIILERHANRLFGTGARPSGILKFPGKLGAEAAKRISTSWHAAHGGAASGKTAVLEDGGEFQGLTFNSVDAQFAEMRTFQNIEIARAFRVPPHMIFEMGRATWANGEQAHLEYLQFSLLPWLRTWEAAYRRTLLTPEERQTRSIEFIVDDLLRADTATRAEAYSKFVAMRAMTPNEVRARENMPAIEGGDVLANPYTTSNESPANV